MVTGKTLFISHKLKCGINNKLKHRINISCVKTTRNCSRRTEKLITTVCHPGALARELSSPSRCHLGSRRHGFSGSRPSPSHLSSRATKPEQSAGAETAPFYSCARDLPRASASVMGPGLSSGSSAHGQLPRSTDHCGHPALCSPAGLQELCSSFLSPPFWTFASSLMVSCSSNGQPLPGNVFSKVRISYPLSLTPTPTLVTKNTRRSFNSYLFQP